MGIIIRPIEHRDNHVIAELIKTVFREFKIDKPGTVYNDPTTNDLFNLFKTEGSAYWIAEEDGVVLGGCGVYPTTGLPENCAELVKFYLLPAARGKAIGRALMGKSFISAVAFGYEQLYLESFPELSTAVNMYEKSGFKHIEKPLGNSGHHACTIWMVKDL
jgi:putative acetyltransferase